ncbi:MAG: CpsD/CapB family tyrosine-protein kinase, partial [Anaerolineae bacterium]|nr:CpsD/CapB family tyrosine-protein kinase [Anaerolineae bacterium]
MAEKARFTPDLITLKDPRSAAAEAYRTLRSNLVFSNLDAKLQRIALTSPAQQEDKSATLANLAVTLAQSEHPTLLVDADLRRPAQHTLWGLDNARGLTSMVLEAQALAAPPIQPTGIPGLSVLTSGPLPPNPADVLASNKMEEVLTKLSSLATYVLFDVPPVLAASDAAVLGRKL